MLRSNTTSICSLPDAAGLAANGGTENGQHETQQLTQSGKVAGRPTVGEKLSVGLGLVHPTKLAKQLSAHAHELSLTRDAATSRA